MAEPTSKLTLSELVLEAAVKMGVAYYGVSGTEIAQVPTDAHDLAECKRHVNNAVRMFIADAPPGSGWRWIRSLVTAYLWPSATGTVSTAVHLSGSTTITAATGTFYATMEGKSITFASAGTFTITGYTSSSVIVVSGNASAAASQAWSITADGDYRLPTSFSGVPNGAIRFQAGSDAPAGIDWIGEADVRAWRETTTVETGHPLYAAVRPLDASGRRRWDLMVYPVPDEVFVVQFPSDIYFDSLVNLTDVPPCPFVHDDTLRAAVRAIVEKDVEDATGFEMEYYRRVALPNSHRLDGRSAPAKLGYFGNPSAAVTNPGRHFRNNVYQRPTVQFIE